jgi:hypothetical protein
MPIKAEERKQEWYSKYESLPNPNEPKKPDGYKVVNALEEDTIGEIEGDLAAI